MKVKVLDSAGKATGREVTLPKELFGVEPNEHAMYLDVKQFLAHQRQGTHKAKERGEIKGSTRKIKKQKGTGTARAGSIKNPLFRGGGRVFGPKPRTYGFKVNKKVKQLARASALSAKANANAIRIVEDFTMAAPKTKEFVKVANAIDASGKALFLMDSTDSNLTKSAANVPNVKLTTLSGLNTYDVMNANVIVFSENALKALSK